MKKILVWFRNDLRLHDHEPLMEACAKADEVIPLYCIEPKFLYYPDGNTRCSEHRLRFLLESVQSLQHNLRAVGSDLVVCHGDSVEMISKFAKKYGVNHVYAFKEVASEEVKINERLEVQLWKDQIGLKLFLGNTLYNKEDLPFPIKDIPDVFTNFRKRVERDSFVRPCFPAIEKITTNIDRADTIIPSLIKAEKLSENCTTKRLQGGESAALQHFQQYTYQNKSVLHYKQTRNQLIGDQFSSRLSAYLSFGCISPRKVFWELKQFQEQFGDNDGCEWLIFELLWRDYFRFMFKKYGNALFREDGIKKVVRTDKAKNEDELFDSWKNAKTGIPFIDANMLELNQTGFMSNRGRQNVASFLINDLHVTWTKGAQYFEEKLTDYNPASNWGNWAYLAGVGNDPREHRYFNILKQARDYDADASFVKFWIPALKSLPSLYAHEPYLLSLEEQKKYKFTLGLDYHKPLVDLKKNSLYYNQLAQR